MKPFSSMAIPHSDIREGRLTMEVFAADLWEVFKGRAPDEYKDPHIFFKKTYMTEGLKNLLYMTEKRLKGEGGDPIIQLQTPFGGGKTHSLIAIFHKAKEWGVNVVVFDGTALDPREVTPWEEIERQLTGKNELLKGRTSPGKEKLITLFWEHQPLLILIDEILQYTTKAASVQVGESTLASQLLSFMQELTGVVRSLDRTMLIVTLPSSILEHYDQSAERLFQQLQKVVGRMERIYTPVKEEEICSVIKRRLFTHINEGEARDVIEDFLDYAEREGVLSAEEKSAYREKFIRCFPFQPEVIDILYKRWGSFPTFQRTRGVLRLLSLVVYSLLNSGGPFIRLADFDLANDDIKRELIKHIGQEYDSVIAADITSLDSGAKKVDGDLGDAYTPFSFGTKAATTIFMYSFSGGVEKGATLREIKLSCAVPGNPSSIVAEAVSKLEERLFYLHEEGGKYFFTNQPNLNRILLTKMESISEEKLEEEEKIALSRNLSKRDIEIYIWPESTKDVPDTKRLKLIIMKELNEEECRKFLENYGEQPRVYRNTLIFLCPSEADRPKFINSLKEKIAWQLIDRDKTLNLTRKQLGEVRERMKRAESQVEEDVKTLYRLVLLPSREGLKSLDLGVPTYGADTSINERVLKRLKEEKELLEKISPLVIKEKYLKDRDYVETKNILESFFRTPGEIRLLSENPFREALIEGINQGLFGLGHLENGTVVCDALKSTANPELVEGEVIVKPDLCLEEKPEVTSEEMIQTSTSILGEETEEIEEPTTQEPVYEPVQKYKTIKLKLSVPAGRLSDVARMLNYLKRKFDKVDVTVEIYADGGEITVSEYEDKILEAIKQADISLEEESPE